MNSASPRRPSRIIPPSLVAALVLAPPVARASEAAEGGGLAGILWHLANLAVFLFVVVVFLGPQLRAYLFQRRKTIESQLNEARKLMADAKARDEEWSRKLEGLQADADRIAGQAREIGRAERDQILAQARKQAERIRGDAERTAAQEVARARAELRDEAVRLAMVLAERLVKENVNEADQKRLIEEYLQSMERNP